MSYHISLHLIASHCIPLHPIASHCISLHPVASHCIPLHPIVFDSYHTTTRHAPLHPTPPHRAEMAMGDMRHAQDTELEAGPMAEMALGVVGTVVEVAGAGTAEVEADKRAPKGTAALVEEVSCIRPHHPPRTLSATPSLSDITARHPPRCYIYPQSCRFWPHFKPSHPTSPHTSCIRLIVPQGGPFEYCRRFRIG